MDSFLIDFPSRVALTIYKQPCTNIDLAPIDGDRSFVWTLGKREKLDRKEVEIFLNDTIELINHTGLYYFEYFIKTPLKSPYRKEERKEELIKSIDIIKQYFTKWGPIINSTKNSIAIYDIQLSLLSAFICLSLWEDKYGFAEQLYHLLDPNDNKILIKSDKTKYWLASPQAHNNDENYFIFFVPEYEYKEYDLSSFWLRIKQPSANEFSQFSKSEDGFSRYIKNQILNSISWFMQQQGVKVSSVKLNPNTFTFDLIINNRLLAFILFNIPELVNTEVKFCRCGCGGFVTGNSKYLPGHSKKAREKGIDRRIKAWLRTKKNRGDFDQEYYSNLCRQVDILISKNLKEQEIRDKIQVMINSIKNKDYPVS